MASTLPVRFEQDLCEDCYQEYWKSKWSEVKESRGEISQPTLRFLFVLSEFIAGIAIVAAALGYLRVPPSQFWIFALAFAALPYSSVMLRRTDPVLFRLGILTFLIGVVVFLRL